MPETPLPCAEYLGLINDCAALNEVAAAPLLADRIRQLAADLVEQGITGSTLCRILSELNDRLAERLINLLRRSHRLPDVPWCWLALGSEGRFEQSFMTDQDNGLIFSATDAHEAEALRALFQPFAQRVNTALADCGFSLCPGGIMAGNARWCLSFDEWLAHFVDWVRRPEPEALLNATIFFDFRPLYGDYALATRLRQQISTLTADASAFLHLMTVNALQAEPPINFRGHLATETGEEGACIDIKKQGTRLFVDAARIFALASGQPAVDTASRLKVAGPLVGLSKPDMEAAIEALNQLQRLRIRRQHEQRQAGQAASNQLLPDQMNELDRAILLEAVRQARQLQQRLKINYGL